MEPVVDVTYPASFTHWEMLVVAKLEAVRPVMATVPGKVVVTPALPIVMPVAVEVPMEMVFAPSMTTLPSPEMLVPLKVSAAEAIEMLARRSRTIAAPIPPPMEIFFIFFVDVIAFRLIDTNYKGTEVSFEGGGVDNQTLRIHRFTILLSSSARVLSHVG